MIACMCVCVCGGGAVVSMRVCVCVGGLVCWTASLRRWVVTGMDLKSNPHTHFTGSFPIPPHTHECKHACIDRHTNFPPGIPHVGGGVRVRFRIHLLNPYPSQRRAARAGIPHPTGHKPSHPELV